MNEKKFSFLLFFLFMTLLSLSFIKIHIKIQTTILGYEIGRLKNEEFTLLKKRSLLTMEFAQLTTKDNLTTLFDKK